MPKIAYNQIRLDIQSRPPSKLLAGFVMVCFEINFFFEKYRLVFHYQSLPRQFCFRTVIPENIAVFVLRFGALMN